MPTVVTMNVWATNKVSGRTTVGCNNVAGGIGSWELRSNGRLCQRDRVGACLEREGRFARVAQSGVPGTPARWEFLKGGRIRQVGTNECVQEGSSHNMEMVSCAGTVRPWRLNGSFSVEGFGNLKASPGLNGAVTGTRFADQEWELNF